MTGKVSNPCSRVGQGPDVEFSSFGVNSLVVAFKMIPGPQVSLAQQISTSCLQCARRGAWALDEQ